MEINENYEISYIIFKDSKGKEYLITKETIELWKKTFKLHSIDYSYRPNIPQNLKEFLGLEKEKEIHIEKDSLFAIVANQYHNAIPQVKQILESPEMIINNGKSLRCQYYVLAKVINNKAYFLNLRVNKGSYFTFFKVSIASNRKKQKEFKETIEVGAGYAILNDENLIQKKLGLNLKLQIKQ